jgi:XTP/dITP diphosphohydrolase
MTILIATNNQHKKIEIQNILLGLNINNIHLVTPESLGIFIEVAETADTLEGNSKLKAVAFAEKSGLPVIADDTGLEIDFLNGQPGVYSARFAGEDGNDTLNRTKVLKLLQNVPESERSAKFRTVICFIHNHQINFIEGLCLGKIADEEKGSNGFGYDPIFIPENFKKSFAEMSPEEKNQISHRSRAIHKFAEFLKNTD